MSFPENSRALLHDALLGGQVGSSSLSSGNTVVMGGVQADAGEAEGRTFSTEELISCSSRACLHTHLEPRFPGLFPHVKLEQFP